MSRRRPAEEPSVEGGRCRLDKWLWHARLVRQREAAASLVESGHVRVEGKRVTAPGHRVKVGDVLTVALDHGVRLIRVLETAERRGDANAAHALYEELS